MIRFDSGSKRRAGAACVWLLLTALMLSGCSSLESLRKPRGPEVKPESWVVLAKWSGESGETTKDVTVTGGEWRLDCISGGGEFEGDASMPPPMFLFHSPEGDDPSLEVEISDHSTNSVVGQQMVTGTGSFCMPVSHTGEFTVVFRANGKWAAQVVAQADADTLADAREFLEAARDGKQRTVRRLLERRPSLLEWKDDPGYTALHYAASAGETAIVDFLLDEGADIDRGDESGQTPLHSAAIDNDTEMVEFLLERGADANAKNDRGETPLSTVAYWDDHKDVADILRRHGAK
jgi:hypothetical protein